jgi:hypothetical protein
VKNSPESKGNPKAAHTVRMAMRNGTQEHQNNRKQKAEKTKTRWFDQPGIGKYIV